jgi:hypothetical protein
MYGSALRALFVSLIIALPVYGEVVRVEVQTRNDLLGGKTFGLAGPYEKLSGKIHFAVDPKNAANRTIADIDLAPRNSSGKVEFSADFYVLKPKRLERGNGAALLEISNRGLKGMLAFYNRATASLDPASPAEVGDGFLMRHGFTLLWVGWQFDPTRPGLLRLHPPLAMENGRPITGLVRSDFVLTQKTHEQNLGDRDHLAYPVANPDDPENTLTVRDSPLGARRTIPRAEWSFARLENGKPIPDRRHIYMASGFEPKKIYEIVYRGQDPPLVGLGLAAARDLTSFVKYGGETVSIPRGTIDRALAFGVSQSGRFLRTYLYFGLNADEAGRRVFDGVLAHVAGGGRGSFNHRFAQPSRAAFTFGNFLYPTDIFPFTDIEQLDPETGARDGLLTHAGKTQPLPKIFYTNSSHEYWGRAASLIHTTVDGLADVPIMDNVRIYLFAGTQHGPGAFPPARTIGEQPGNPHDFRWSMRALLLAMDRWVAEGKEPPPSRYPRIDHGTLVSATKVRFPGIPGVRTSTAAHRAYRVDYGPDFTARGIVTKEPPKVGNPFPIMMSQVDADGNEVAGVRLPDVAVPLATYAGWNLYNSQSGPDGVLANLHGAYIPFSFTRVEREQSKDPRPSIEERYQNREHYLGLVAKAAMDLIQQGYLLDHDLREILSQAERHWDYLATRIKTASR